MSINNVNINNNQGLDSRSDSRPRFDLRHAESLVYQSSSSRQYFSIKSEHDNDHPINLSASDGYIYLTNERFIYITSSQGDIISFSLEFKHMSLLQFSHSIKSPWFGPNYWQFLFFSSRERANMCDGLPSNQWYRGEVKFKDGGLFDFVPLVDQLLNDATNNGHIDEELPRYESL